MEDHFLKVGGHAFSLISEIEDDQSRDHKYDSSSHEQGIQCEEYGIDYGHPPIRRLRIQKVKYGFAEEDDHQADADGRPVEILLCIQHVYRIQCDQWVEQPDNTDPDKHDKGSSRDFSCFHCFLSYRK